jgi:hypothetical protein
VPTPPEKYGLQGRLDVASPFEIGQFLLLGNKTGALHMIQGEQRGVLYVLDGQIVSAVGPDLKGGPEAAMRMLSWKSGTFHFIPEPVARSKEIEMHTENLLLETARLMDETGQGEQQVAAAMEQADELSRTFAALSSPATSANSADPGKPLEWLLADPGRQLVHRLGRPLYGRHPGRAWVSFSEKTLPEPAALLGVTCAGPPCNAWFEHKGHRLYLTWGTDGYRLVHPIPRVMIEQQMGEAADVRARLAASPLVVVFAEPGGGRDLLLGVLTLLRSESGMQTLYISGVPAIDIEDGRSCIHQVLAPGGSGGDLRAALARWQPDLIVADFEVEPEADALLRDAYWSGAALMLAVRATDARQAMHRVRDVVGEDCEPLLIRAGVDEGGFSFDIAAAA